MLAIMEFINGWVTLNMDDSIFNDIINNFAKEFTCYNQPTAVNVLNVFDKETRCCGMSMYQGIHRPRISISFNVTRYYL